MTTAQELAAGRVRRYETQQEAYTRFKQQFAAAVAADVVRPQALPESSG